MTSKSITGKVAQILTDRELVINAGRNDGVKEGMVFAVMASVNPIEVIDPDTGEKLGSIDQEKIRVEAVTVEGKYAVCRTRSFRTPGGAFYNIQQSIGGFEKPKVIQETLSVAESDYPKALAPEDSFVQRGDRVKQVPNFAAIPEDG